LNCVCPCPFLHWVVVFVKDYARQWLKREKEDLYIFAEWVKGVAAVWFLPKQNISLLCNIKIIVKAKLNSGN